MSATTGGFCPPFTPSTQVPHLVEPPSIGLSEVGNLDSLQREPQGLDVERVPTTDLGRGWNTGG